MPKKAVRQRQPELSPPFRRLSNAWNYQLPNPILKHTRTDSQSESESLPINRTSRWGRVTGNSLKYDAACSPACFQSRNAQSVGANGVGACVVIGPTTTSGLCRW